MEKELKNQIKKLRTQKTQQEKQFLADMQSIICFLEMETVPRDKIIDYIKEYVLCQDQKDLSRPK